MLAIIGGSGLYTLDSIQKTETITVETPFGRPSGAIMRGHWGRHEVLFLPRHGSAHQLLPHEINYRANVFALKQLGATRILSVSAVGSLREQIEPGHLAVPDQFFDWTRGRRASSFFGEGIAAHVSTARPVSANMAQWVTKAANGCGMPVHTGVTYAAVEGPRLGTRAESLFLRQAGCDIVGMTNVPEAFLAREAQICYASIGIVTDYDCWKETADAHVVASEIFERYRQSLGKTLALLESLMDSELPEEEGEIRTALTHAIVTPKREISEDQHAWLEVLRK
jgi:5'-methylthioadenosine phosphorylase